MAAVGCRVSVVRGMLCEFEAGSGYLELPPIGSGKFPGKICYHTTTPIAITSK